MVYERCVKCGRLIPIGDSICYKCDEYDYECRAQLKCIAEYKEKKNRQKQERKKLLKNFSDFIQNKIRLISRMD